MQRITKLDNDLTCKGMLMKLWNKTLLASALCLTLFGCDDASKVDNKLDKAKDNAEQMKDAAADKAQAIKQDADKQIDTLKSQADAEADRLKDQASAIKAEADRLIQRRRVLEHNMRRMQEYLALVLDGEKFSSPRCTVSYRRSEGTETDPEFIDWAREHRPELLMEQQPKIDTQQLKRELKDGLVCDHARLVERQNVQVR